VCPQVSSPDIAGTIAVRHYSMPKQLTRYRLENIFDPRRDHKGLCAFVWCDCAVGGSLAHYGCKNSSPGGGCANTYKVRIIRKWSDFEALGTLLAKIKLPPASALDALRQDLAAIGVPMPPEKRKKRYSPHIAISGEPSQRIN